MKRSAASTSSFDSIDHKRQRRVNRSQSSSVENVDRQIYIQNDINPETEVMISYADGWLLFQMNRCHLEKQRKDVTNKEDSEMIYRDYDSTDEYAEMEIVEKDAAFLISSHLNMVKVPNDSLKNALIIQTEFHKKQRKSKAKEMKKPTTKLSSPKLTENYCHDTVTNSTLNRNKTFSDVPEMSNRSTLEQKKLFLLIMET